MPENRPSQIEQLRFLLESSAGPKFLFVVFDVAGKETIYIEEVYKPLKNHRAAVIDVAGINTSRILDALIRVSHAAPQSINLVDIAQQPASTQKGLFYHLNFSRDPISAIGVPIVLWFDEVTLVKFAALAPDFWSRRSAVIRLSDTRPTDRIRALFANYRTPKQTIFENEMANAVGAVLDCEGALKKIFGGDSVPIAKIDEKIRRLRGAVSILARWIRSGKAVDVVFWLWNTLQLDAFLQKIAAKRSPEWGTSVDLLLDQRNEVLVRISGAIGVILEEYDNGIKDACAERQPLSLRSKIAAEAEAALRVLASDYADEIGAADARLQSSRNDLDLFYNYNSAINEFQPALLDPGVEQSLRNKAALELDSYLSGASSSYSHFFTEDEIALLRILYRKGESGAGLPRPSHDHDAEKIDELYRRVLLYLGEI